MKTYSAKIHFEAPSDEVAYDMLCRFLYAYEQMDEEGVDMGVVSRNAVILPGTIVDEFELERDRQFGEALSQRESAALNPNPLPADFPQV